MGIMEMPDILGKKSKKDDMLEEINVLGLNIHVLNQSLTTANLGDDPVLRKKITEVVNHMNYLYGSVTKIEKNIDEKIDKGFESVAKYVKDVEKRINVISMLANQLYQINQVELIRMQDNIEALEKIVGSNKELWHKLNTIKLDMLKKPSKLDDKFKVLSKDIGSGAYSEKVEKIGDLMKETDSILKEVKAQKEE